MSFAEFVLFLAAIALVGWYCWRVTRVSDALEEYARQQDRQNALDQALIREVGKYVCDVVLPELTYRAAMRQPDDERTIAAKALVAVLTERCAHYLQQPVSLTPSNEETAK